MTARSGLVLLALLGGARDGAAQSVLEQSPNLHGTWTLERGRAAFVFAHRFELIEGGDEMFNVPTMSLAVGLPLGLTAGLDFSSNSEVLAERPGGNETQYYLKAGAAVGPETKVAALAAYNTAARSFDGALDVRRDWRALSLFGELRGFSDLFGRGDEGAAGAVGGAVRLTPYLALTGDVGRVLTVDSVPSVWSAAAAVAIPGSPHTLSLHATNGGAITLQGASRSRTRDFSPVRYGFVFTVPLGPASRWARIFRPAPAPQRAPDVAARVEMRGIAFSEAETRIRPGESVEWINAEPAGHTVTGDDGSWGSEVLREGGRYVRRFDAPGRYPYHCSPHPGMTGVVVVGGD